MGIETRCNVGFWDLEEILVDSIGNQDSLSFSTIDIMEEN